MLYTIFWVLACADLVFAREDDRERFVLRDVLHAVHLVSSAPCHVEHFSVSPDRDDLTGLDVFGEFVEFCQHALPLELVSLFEDVCDVLEVDRTIESVRAALEAQKKKLLLHFVKAVLSDSEHREHIVVH
jgi:hypothetical protein